ncbi:MAG: primosomal protein N' [Planctomycetota bacterium]
MPKQQSLFDTAPPAWEADADEERLQATVVLPQGPPGEFDYLVPDELADARRPESLAEPGRRVRAPFGGRPSVVGYCVAVGVKPVGGRKLKRLAAVVDPQTLLSPGMLRLTKWMAERYLCPWGAVLEAVVPSGVRGRAGTRETVLLSVPTGVAARLASLKVTDAGRRALEVLIASPKPLTTQQLMHRAGCKSGPISTLRKNGLVTAHTERLDTGELDQQDFDRESPKQLNEDQSAALKEILAALDSTEHRTLLVHGVTGSGKTEVYIQAIEKVVSFGRQAIVLVPEISLTPQTVGRFRARFDSVAVLHSHQTDVERHRHWRRIAAGEVQVVVGARSAIFAPTRHLGLIVIDEEHENSFKQDSAPRYHAREVALQRARDESLPVVLASATPSLETWHAAQQGRVQLIAMPRRVNNLPMPTVSVVDLRQEAHRTVGRHGAISRPLHQAMHAALGDGGQVILLLNRRGFSTHVQCPSCGFALKCPECDVSMTFHRHEAIVLCHWCDRREPPPNVCPECKDASIRYGGFGTQKLEAEVRARFPKHRCLRMDADTTRRPGSHEETLDQFRCGEASILLGTQMIAKGLDFPNVTVVGVLSADSALHWPDFRSAERTFHLVTQVAGRTGRSSRGGRVLVQALDPEHAAITAAAKHDFHAFAKGELPEREAAGYPPFGALLRVIVRGEAEPLAAATADAIAEGLRKLGGDAVRVLGPAPAPLAKLRGAYRFHFLAQSTDGPALRAAAAEALAANKPPDGVLVAVDVDPVDMM